MPDLSDLADFLDEEDGFDTPPMPSREYPREEGGRSYHVPSPDAVTGLRLAALSDIALKQRMKVEVTQTDIARLRFDDDDEREFMAQVLSEDTLQAMLDDGCRWEHIKRMGQYAYIRFAISPEAADEAVERGLLRGKALAPEPANRAGRRTAAKSARQGSAASSSRTAQPRARRSSAASSATGRSSNSTSRSTGTST